MSFMSRATLAMILCGMLASASSAQKGIPIPHFAPRPPVFHPVPIHGVTHGGGGGNGAATVDPAVVIAIVVGVVAMIVVAVIVVRAWNRQIIARLRIIRTPPGEAPEEIRKAWIGVELPLRRRETRPGNYPTEGVVSRGGREMAMGYAVDGRAAIAVLAVYAPEAAAWWRKHAPQVLAPGYRLWFPRDACQGPDDFAVGADGKGGVWHQDVSLWEKK